LKLKTMRDIHPYRHSDPNLFLVSCDRLTQEAQQLPPLILYERNGEYTQEMQSIFSGRIHGPTL
jgi:tRNA1(Val) A37 N6-methylase TrmN6